MKRQLMIVLLGAVCMGSWAQGFRLGAEAGLNVSSPKNMDTRLGYHVGFLGEYDFRSREKGVLVSLGLWLSEKGARSAEYYDVAEGTEMRWTMRPAYLEIPLHVGYRFALGESVSLWGSLGPYLGVGLFGKERMTTRLNGASATATVAQNVFHHMHRVDAGLGLRLGAEFVRHYRLSVGYDWGLTNLRSVPAGAYKERNRNLSVSFGYVF